MAGGVVAAAAVSWWRQAESSVPTVGHPEAERGREPEVAPALPAGDVRLLGPGLYPPASNVRRAHPPKAVLGLLRSSGVSLGIIFLFVG